MLNHPQHMSDVSSIMRTSNKINEFQRTDVARKDKDKTPVQNYVGEGSYLSA